MKGREMRMRIAMVLTVLLVAGVLPAQEGFYHDGHHVDAAELTPSQQTAVWSARQFAQGKPYSGYWGLFLMEPDLARELQASGFGKYVAGFISKEQLIAKFTRHYTSGKIPGAHSRDVGRLFRAFISELPERPISTAETRTAGFEKWGWTKNGFRGPRFIFIDPLDNSSMQNLRKGILGLRETTLSPELRESEAIKRVLARTQDLIPAERMVVTRTVLKMTGTEVQYHPYRGRLSLGLVGGIAPRFLPMESNEPLVIGSYSKMRLIVRSFGPSSRQVFEDVPPPPSVAKLQAKVGERMVLSFGPDVQKTSPRSGPILRGSGHVAYGMGTSLAAFMLKETVGAVHEAVVKKNPDAFVPLASALGNTEFYKSLGAYTIVGGSINGLFNGLLPKPAPARLSVLIKDHTFNGLHGVLRAGIPMALGIMAMDSANGTVDAYRALRTTGSYLFAGGIYDFILRTAVSPQGRVTKVTHDVLRLTTTLGLGGYLESKMYRGSTPPNRLMPVKRGSEE